MKIDRLRISGFKSFADPVEVAIDPGMTGIVGPNGCGKSNLIEAFRWAMGETSAKRMRAEGMDDVIFGGTDVRPPKSVCEVTVGIDPDGRAPQEFADAKRLEVSRRLERGDGSSYRVNGKPSRARDVSVLFKDAGIGAGSSAIVSQGKVGAIISAKPSERRTVLEEAAGVTGLASRRNEAEIRLRGTEQNLERAVDMEKGLAEQVSSLRRQARQARRMKEMDGLVRAAEATAFLVRWRMSDAGEKAADSAFNLNEDGVKQAVVGLLAAERALQAAEAEAAPALRAKTESETAVALAKARVENVRKEANSARASLAAASKAADRARADIERETAAIGGAGEEYEELKDRMAIALDDREYDAVLLEEAGAAMVEAKDVYDGRAADLSGKSEALAASRAERSGALRRLEEVRTRVSAAGSKAASAAARSRSARDGMAALPAVDAAVVEAELALGKAEAAEAAVSESLRRAVEAESQARIMHSDARMKLAALVSEAAALSSGLSGEGGAIDRVVAAPGYEQAAASAFGEGAGASLGGDGGRRWVGVSARADVPDGFEALSVFLELPDELLAAVSGVGIVRSGQDGDGASASLRPGQSLVSEDGTMWRWDGYRSQGGSEAAERLKRIARLREIDGARAGLELKEADLALALAAAVEVLSAVTREHAGAKAAVPSARADLEAARRRVEDVERQREKLKSEMAAATEAEAAAAEALEDATAALVSAEEAVSALPNDNEAASAVEKARRAASEAAQAYEVRRSALEKVRRDAEARVLLIQNVEQQMKDFDRRIAAARDVVAELRERLKEAEEDGRRIADCPELSAEAEAEAMSGLEEAAAVLEAAASAARVSEDRLSSARSAVKEGELAAAGLKEERARLLAELKAARDARQNLEREIAERMALDPSALPGVAGVDEGATLPELPVCEQRVARLVKERDGVGAVNLLAEEQLAEAEAKLGETNKARDELREAVRRLRSTIAEFDREARDRLTEAFSAMDGHFRDLFARLFGGGHAYLRLAGSDDILEAGLEIYACPPGKKLQAMSLLSGGEQALAALALVFAAFLIRPAPVCVLDEVDAPLDDANVDRLCSLVEDMSKGSTRFLVVTHHALTMARCHRLYGVTMAERGVSRVTVLDMEQAAAYASS